MSDLLPLPDHISFSQCSVLDHTQKFGCSRKWAFERRAGIPWAPSPAMLLGTIFDKAVEVLLQPRAAGRGNTSVELNLEGAMDRLAAEVEWAVGDAEQEQDIDGMAALVAAAPVLAPSLVLYADQHRDTPVAVVQHEFTFYWQKIPVLGFVDRIDNDRRIVDLKVTGNPPWTVKEPEDDGERDFQDGVWWKPDDIRVRRLQLAFYATAMEDEALTYDLPFSWPVPVGLDVCVVRKNQAEPNIHYWQGEITEAERDNVRRVVENGWARARSGVYPPHQGPACRNCSYVELCNQMSETEEPAFEAAWSRVH